jgi:hypothetical protein
MYLSLLYNTTVSVCASEASLNTQKQFSEMVFLNGIYDLLTPYLYPARHMTDS